jgi:hypothetical protein
MPLGSSQAECSHMKLASRKWQSHISIKSLMPGAVRNSSPIQTSKPVKLHKFWLLHIPFLPHYHTTIWFRRRHCNGSWVISRWCGQSLITDNISPRKQIRVSILKYVSIFVISVTKLSEMIICWCMCKGHMAHKQDLDSKPSWLTFNQRNIVLRLTGKWEHAV